MRGWWTRRHGDVVRPEPELLMVTWFINLGWHI